MTLVMAAGSGILFLWRATEGLETVYVDRIEPLADLKAVSDSYAIDMSRAPHLLLLGQIDWQKALTIVEAARETAATHWKLYAKTYMDAEEKAGAAATEEAMRKADARLNELASILAERDRAQLDRFAATELYPAIDPVREAIARLVAMQVAEAKTEYHRSQGAYPTEKWIVAVCVAVGLTYLLYLGLTIAQERR